MATYFIVGSSRGLGLEFTKQILENYANNKVIAGARKPTDSAGLQDLLQKFPSGRLTLVALDVENTESVEAAASKIAQTHPEGIDYIINNAGIVGSRKSLPEDFLNTMNTNVVGPMRVIRAFLPHIQKGNKKVVVNITSRAGSIEAQEKVGQLYKTFGEGASKADFIGYRASKAALNCVTQALAQAYKEDGVTLIVIHPGRVDTDMLVAVGVSKDTFGDLGVLSPQISAKGQLEVIHKINIEDTGKFFYYNGDIIPW